MKYIVVLLVLSMTIACSHTSETEVVNLTNEEVRVFQSSIQDLKQSVGYYELIMDEASPAEEWLTLFDEVNSNFSDHPRINQFNLDVIKHLVTETDYLATVTNKNSMQLQELFDKFKTSGGLEVKYLLLRKMSDYYSTEVVEDYRIKSLNNVDKYKLLIKDKKLFLKTVYEKNTDHTDDLMTMDLLIKSAQNKIDDLEYYLPLLERGFK